MNSSLSFPLSEKYSVPKSPVSAFSKHLYRHAFKTNSWKTLLTEDPKDLPEDFLQANATNEVIDDESQIPRTFSAFPLKTFFQAQTSGKFFIFFYFRSIQQLKWKRKRRPFASFEIRVNYRKGNRTLIK